MGYNSLLAEIARLVWQELSVRTVMLVELPHFRLVDANTEAKKAEKEADTDVEEAGKTKNSTAS